MALSILKQGPQDAEGFIQVQGQTISFTVQEGPIREVGLNGCQIDDIIHTAKAIIEALNSAFPCEENTAACEKLGEALDCLEARKRNRESRGVEGTSQK